MINNTKPVVTVVDDFLVSPQAAREEALKQEYKQQRSKGVRSLEQFNHKDFIPVFEKLLGKRITEWDLDMNGRYQYCTSEDPLVYHTDLQTHAASIFLTPDAPPEAGLRLLRSKRFGLRYDPTEAEAKDYDERLGPGDLRAVMFRNFLDPSLWETVDQIGNVYNRLVIWDARHIHAAASYFGTDKTNSRLFQVFFFNVENY